MKKVEIACCNLESVINAINGGATRIELFENLEDGGCTPSYGMIKKAKAISIIPIYVMIRPRGGNFVYNSDELDIMKTDIETCNHLNVDGIVFGILKENNEIDSNKCKELLAIWNNKPATFHRAFDVTNDIEKSINALIELGFERVLTSGGRSSAVDGINVIQDLNKRYKDKISIMAGSGITPENANLFSELDEVHATCKVVKKGSGMFGDYKITDEKLVKELKKNFYN
jgi:copper homeostasis protein